MNILLLTKHLNSGGIASYVVSLAKILKARGHNVIISSSGGELVGYLNKKDIRHLTIDMDTKADVSPKILSSYLKLSKTIKENNIQIIHAQTRVSQVLACLLKKFQGIPFVSTCHGFFKPRFNRIYFPCWGDKVIAISKAVKKHLIEDLKVKPQDIELIYNGLDFDNFQKYEPNQILEYKKWIGLKDGPVIGNIARLSSVKGQDYLIKAMKDVVKKFPSAQLLFVGDGKIKDDLVNLSQQLGLNENIKFIPSVEHTSSVLALMDVFVMCSLQEGLGLSIMEAQAMEVPVIASCVGGIPELIEDNKTGILVSPKDPKGISQKIIYLLENKEYAQTLAQNAKRNVLENFSLGKMIDKTEELYKKVINVG